MDTNRLLHMLRNPYGYSHDEKREACLQAANEIEKWIDAFKNMQDFARQNGLDTTAYPIDQECIACGQSEENCLCDREEV